MIALRDQNNQESTTPASTVPVTVPGTTHVGDEILVFVYVNGSPTITAPGSWTQIGTQANTSNGASVTAFSKIAVSGDIGASPTFTLSVSGRSASVVRVYSGVDLSTPIDVGVGTASGSSVSPTAPSRTPVHDNAMSVVAYAASAAAAIPPATITWATPTSYGNPGSTQTSGTSGGGNVYAATFDDLLGIAAPTGTVVTGVSPSRSWAALHVILRPKTNNTPPTVDAGVNQTVNSGNTVTLTATTFDADGDTVTVNWDQTDGSPLVTLNGTGASRTFTAPNQSTVLTFTATADDGTDATTDDMTVTVIPQSTWTIALRATASTDGTTPTSNPSVTIPGSTQFGDDILIFLYVNGAQTVTAPQGWTLLATQVNGSGGVTVRVYRKLADSGDAGSTVIFGLTTSARSYLIARVYSGVDTITPEDVTTLTGIGTGTSPAAPSQTPANSQAMSVVVYATSAAAAAPATEINWTAPSGYGHSFSANTTGTSGGGNVYAATYDKQLSGTSATGNVLATIDSSRQWAGVHILLRVKTSNTPPVVNAGPDQSASAYETVTLTATATDADGDTVTLSWAQTGGSPAVTLSGSDGISTFVAPAVRAGTSLTFTASGDDGTATSTDSCVVTVYPANEFAVVSGAEVPIDTGDVAS